MTPPDLHGVAPRRALYLPRDGKWVHGEDVKALQRAVNARLGKRGLSHYACDVDGYYGPGTALACRKALWILGAALEDVRRIDPEARGPGHALGIYEQLIIRLMTARSPAMLSRATARRLSLRKDRPRLITSCSLGLHFSYPFGSKATPFRGAWHYTAGARARDAQDLRSQMRAIHSYHVSKGWGGLSYEALIADDGTIGLGNPITRKSAAVAFCNTGLVNICCPGTTGDRLTREQVRSVRWLRDNWHKSYMPRAHRLSRPAVELSWLPHCEMPFQFTACPGSMVPDYRRAWRDD